MFYKRKIDLHQKLIKKAIIKLNCESPQDDNKKVQSYIKK